MFKRGGVWWTCIRYKGRKIQKSLETLDKRMAQAIEAKIRTQLVEGKFFEAPEGKEKTFRDLAEKYLLEWTVKKTLRSQERDKGIFKIHLIPIFGNMLIADIGPKHISHYKQKRKEKGANSDTINKELGLMKASFNVAIREWEWINSNPVSKVRMEKTGQGRVRFLAQGEFEAIHDACEDWLRPIVVVARYTGLRMGNLLNLTWDQVNLFKRLIIIGKTKNDEPIGLPACNTLFEILKALNKVRALKSNQVFHTTLSPSSFKRKVQRAFKAACEKAMIEDFRFHDLRHDFASMLIQRGVDIYTVQVLLGHKDGRMTRRYAHLAAENLQFAVDVLDNPDYNLTTGVELKGGIKL